MSMARLLRPSSIAIVGASDKVGPGLNAWLTLQRLAPVSEDTARAMIKETRAATLLGGWRGRPPGDVDAAARAVARLSEFVADFREQVREVEINPLAVLERGVCALDCVIVPREEAST